MLESNNIKRDYKAPPTVGKDSLYVNWQEEVKIWEGFTSIPEQKRSPTIFTTLTGEARETILNWQIEKLAARNGMQILIKELDKIYLKNESAQAYQLMKLLKNLCDLQT